MKKGRVGIETRPEPTIYGNCDSWNLIVGRKWALPSPTNRNSDTLWCGNRLFIHKL